MFIILNIFLLKYIHKIKTNPYNCEYSDIVIDKINHNIFIMNMRSGGTGKSYLIHTILTVVRKLTSDEKVNMAMPSGVAAYNIGSVTLHGLLGLQETNGKTSTLFRNIQINCTSTN